MSEEVTIEEFTPKVKWTFLNSILRLNKCSGCCKNSNKNTQIPKRNSLKSNIGNTFSNDMLLSYYIFDKSCFCLSHFTLATVQYEDSFQVQSKKNDFHIADKTIMGIAKWFISSQSINSNQKKIKCNKVKFENFKTYIISQGNFIIITNFRSESNRSFCKLLSLHLLISFINYIGDKTQIIENINNNNNNTNKNDREFISIYEMGKQKKINQKIIKNFFPFIIFENFYSKFLTYHFTLMFTYIIQKETFIIQGIHFKNIVIVNLNFLDESSTNFEILFDLRKTQNSKRRFQIDKYPLVFKEILFHAKKLMLRYIKEHKSQFNDDNLLFRFIKLELTSSYPRYTFIIKFLPILQGVCLIHIYSQKKLSRVGGKMQSNENSNKSISNREIDLLDAQDLKNDDTVNFKYSEPQKMSDIDFFMIEFYILRMQSDNIFNDPKFKIKYFNDLVNKEIDKIIQNSKDFDIVIKDTKDKLEKILKMTETTKTEKERNETRNDNPNSISSIPDRVFSSEKFNQLLELHFKEVLKLMVGPEENIFKIKEKHHLKNNSFSSCSPSNLSLNKNNESNFLNQTLFLNEVENPFNVSQEISLTINQSKSVSIIKKIPMSNTQKINVQKKNKLEDLLSESEFILEEKKIANQPTKTSSDYIENGNSNNVWDKRIIKRDKNRQQMILFNEEIKDEEIEGFSSKNIFLDPTHNKGNIKKNVNLNTPYVVNSRNSKGKLLLNKGK